MSDGERKHGESDGSDNGVDVTLIHWMLSLTPAELLRVLIHGAPVATFDLDIVPERSDDNLARLVRALWHRRDSRRSAQRVGNDRPWPCAFSTWIC